MRLISLVFSISLFTLALGSLAQAAPQRQHAVLIRVVDGDTLKIRQGRYEDRVRLIGIDSPEKAPNEKAFRDVQRTHQDMKTITSLGKRAQEHMEEILKPGQKIELEFDVEQRDRHGRLLAYIYSESGDFINLRMVRDGYASLMTIPPNVRYSKILLAAFEEARSNRRGIWAK